MSKFVDEAGVSTLASAIIGSTKTISGVSIWGEGNIDALPTINISQADFDNILTQAASLPPITIPSGIYIVECNWQASSTNYGIAPNHVSRMIFKIYGDAHPVLYQSSSNIRIEPLEGIGIVTRDSGETIETVKIKYQFLPTTSTNQYPLRSANAYTITYMEDKWGNKAGFDFISTTHLLSHMYPNEMKTYMYNILTPLMSYNANMFSNLTNEKVTVFDETQSDLDVNLRRHGCYRNIDLTEHHLPQIMFLARPGFDTNTSMVSNCKNWIYTHPTYVTNITFGDSNICFLFMLTPNLYIDKIELDSDVNYSLICTGSWVDRKSLNANSLTRYNPYKHVQLSLKNTTSTGVGPSTPRDVHFIWSSNMSDIIATGSSGYKFKSFVDTYKLYSSNCNQYSTIVIGEFNGQFAVHGIDDAGQVGSVGFDIAPGDVKEIEYRVDAGGERVVKQTIYLNDDTTLIQDLVSINHYPVVLYTV